MAIINLSSTLFPNVVGTPFGDIIYSVSDPAIAGSGGVQTMYGGLGSDTYVINTTTDTVCEFVGEGIDLVVIAGAGNYVLAANVENMIDRANANNSLTGNALGNSITVDDMGATTGNNDTLDGGAGNDTLAGGLGADSYIVDSAGDIINEVANTFTNGLVNGFVIPSVSNGIDSVSSSVTWILGANLENLTLTGTLNINGTGNALDNDIAGNSGFNILDGGAGHDSLSGGGGNDTLRGGDGRDTLNGTGSDATLDGGLGDDIYLLDSLTDSIVGDAGGIDLVELNNAALNVFVVHPAIENVHVGTATATRITGNGLDNYFAGNTAADTLLGGAGNDVLDGAAGADSMVGGAGDDVYVVDNVGDVTSEGPGGSGLLDSVYSSVAWHLAPTIERLILTGASNIEGQGNAAANFIGGNTGNNVLKGFEGNDTIDGGAGFDSMSGGKGNDTYFVDNTSVTSRDLVFEMAGAAEGTGDLVNSSIDIFALYDNVERLVLTGTANLIGRGNALGNRIDGNSGNNELDGAGGNDSLFGGAGADTYIIDSASDGVTDVANVILGGVLQAGSIDTVIYRGTGTYTVAANVEIARIDLVGNGIHLVGNIEHNTLLGSNGTNSLTGGIGNDSLFGGGGNDTLIGGDGLDFLDGQGGGDSMAGGAGNDTYLFTDLSDVIDETTGSGIDTVITHRKVTDLGTQVSNFKGQIENLTLGGGALSGTGNALGNVLTGNGAANTLAGGLGNDTYNADLSDTIIESSLAGGGSGDLVRLDVGAASGTYIAPLNVEHVTLLGTGNYNVVVQKGPVAVSNTLTGNDGNNLLNGADGNDSMVGLKGNDTYYVDSLLDKTVEVAGGGIDTVFSTVTWILAPEVENLNLVGNAPANGTGNALDNFIRGNGFSNILTGGAGNDTLDGGGSNDVLNGADGNDTYWVDRTTDVIQDTTGTDTVISTAAAWTLGAGLENLVLFNGWAIPHNQDGVGNGLNNIITGNAGDNIVDGAGGNDLFDFATFGTLSASDQIIGGANNDTLDANISGLAGGDEIDMAGVEHLIIRATNATNGVADLNLVTDGLQTITATASAGRTLGIDNLQLQGAALPLIILQDLDANTLNVTLANSAGGNDVLNFAVRDSGMNNVTINTTGVETIKIDNQSAPEGNIASNTISNGFAGATLIEVTGTGGTGLVLNNFDGATLTAGTTTFLVKDYNDRLTLQQTATTDTPTDAITVSVHNSNFWLDVGQVTADRDFETINLSSSATGSASWVHLNEAATWMNGTLVIGGSTALSVDGITAGAINASSFTGPSLYLRADTATGGTYTGPTSASVNVTMIGGTGGDSFAFATAGALGDNDFIDGVSGTDTVTMNITGVSVGPRLANIDTTTVTNTGTGELDATLVSGNVAMAGGSGTLTTINNLQGNFTANGWTGEVVVIAGNNGAHTLTAGTGTNTLLGNPDQGAPGDTFAMGTTLDSTDVLNGFDYTLTGQDTMTATLNSAATYAPTVGGVEVLTFTVNANSIIDGSNIVGGTTWTFSNVGAQTLQVINLNSVDNMVLNAAGMNGATTITGSSGDDSINGSIAAGSLNGGMGDDTLTGGAAADVLNGDAGNDVLSGAGGADSLFGGDGDDRLIGGNAGNDTLDGGLGRDTADYSGATPSAVNVNLGTGVVSNDGNAGVDTIVVGTVEGVIGSAFADTLTGNHVTLLTQTLADLPTILEGRALNDVLDGGGTQAGYVDLASYSGALNGVIVNLGGSTVSHNGQNVLANRAADITGGTSVGTDTLTNIDGAIGSDFADVLVGGSTSANIAGEKFEVFIGGGGADTIAGSAGALAGTVDATDFDLASYQFDAGSVFVDLRLGNALDGSGSTDLLYDITHVRGSMYSDILTGGDPNNDALEVLEGMGGNDHLDGGTGNDIASYRNSTSAVNASLLTGAASNDGFGGADSLVNMEGLSGGDFNDTLVGAAGADTISGGAGNDSLTGGGGNDMLDYRYDADGGVEVDLAGGTANDGYQDIDTFSGFEHVFGSMGADSIVGDGGANSLLGGGGNDTLGGRAGADTLDGGAGLDLADYSEDTAGIIFTVDSAGTPTFSGDTLISIEGVIGGSGNDSLTGDAAANVFNGGIGADTLSGLAGADTLLGGSGNDIDVLIGGTEDDLLAGGFGNDVLTGDAGIDRFVFDTALGATNVDVITDMTAATDIIQLNSAVFTGLSAGALGAAAFYSAADITTGGAAGQYILYENDTGNLYYDVDGNGVFANSVLFAVLTGNPAITQTDFIIV